jgi:GntR family transcriptional regulator / MocR family aminotransferase
MFLELDGHGPHYAQLTRAIKAAVLSGRLASGARLPPTRALAQELGLSRITVLAAYEQLRGDGFIMGRVGSGSYVSTLQLTPALPPPESTVAPPSRYAKRARAVHDRMIPLLHNGLPYNLQYGNPLTNPALNTAWGRELAHAAAYTPMRGVGTQGLEALRQQVCNYLARRRGLKVFPENVLIVNGTQQAYALSARVLIDENDVVVMEEPHYFAAYQALDAHGAAIHVVRTDNDGIVCDELPEIAPRLVCVTPSHQFPSGVVLSLPRRLQLLRYAASKQCWILEDDYDGEFRYDGHPLAALRSLDDGDRVIYVGTFTKALFGSLRLGYMVVPAALRQDFITAKYYSDISSSGIEQTALAHFMDDGGFERHLRLTRKELQARREALVNSLRQHAGDRVDIVDTPAGMHVVVWLRHYDYALTEALIALAHERGLGLHPMAPHYLKKPPRPGLILGYCSLSPSALREAMKLFGECLDVIDAKTRGSLHVA